jgi:hypothetical protein
MPAGFDPATYNTVAERIEAFIAKYPDGSLQAEVIELSDHRVVMRGLAYRSPEDTHPGIGHSAMPIPATNTMLRNSEIETAETSAWGRAIAALGFEVKKGVATSNEIEAKKGSNPVQPDALVEPTDGSLIGVAEVGKVGSGADFELRQTPEGPVCAFRLTQGRKGWKVIAHGALAVSLAALKPEGQRVSVWGSMQDETFAKGGKDITFQVVNLERIKGDDFYLPYDDEATPEPIWPDITPEEAAEIEAHEKAEATA